MNFSLNTLRTFIVVAHKQNLSAAAKELRATQPNVGRQMTALAKELNLTLFVRHSRGISLTKQGEDFLAVAEDIFGQLAQKTNVIREKDSAPQGSLKVVSGAGILDGIFKKLPLFSKKFPEIYFDFSSVVNVYHLQNEAHQLQIGDSDVAIIPDSISDPDFIQNFLYGMQMRIYASPSYLEEHGVPNNLEDLKSHKLIMYTGEHQEILNDQFKCDTIKNPLKPFITVRNGPAMRSALLSGCGIGCYAYDQELIERNLLIDIFPDMPDQIITYYYAYHCRLEGSPKIQAFYDFLKEEVVTAWERP